MIRFFRSALLLLIAAISFSQKVTSEEDSQTATRQDRKIGNHEMNVLIHTDDPLNAAGSISSLSANNEALTFRRSGQLYSWRGNCYTQDGEQNWYQIDARLC